MTYTSTFRVYYEDTDMGGIVYHANYLRYMERGRSDALREMGVDQAALRAQGLVFVVAHMAIDFRAPARFDEQVTVTSGFGTVKGASAEMLQRVAVGERVCIDARVRVAMAALDGGVRRFPAHIREALARKPQG